MRKNDWILFAFIAAAAIIWCGLQMFVFSGTGSAITVTQDGKIIGTWPLKENTSLTFAGEAGGSNTLVIEDGTAYMSDADCPDKLCMHQKAVSGKGESIICLPHRLVIEVTAGKTNETDAITR